MSRMDRTVVSQILSFNLLEPYWHGLACRLNVWRLWVRIGPYVFFPDRWAALCSLPIFSSCVCACINPSFCVDLLALVRHDFSLPS
jgi:hypothetical protein